MPKCKCYTQTSSALTIRTLTCNKLSHCLFDFDCPDFSMYEQEKYMPVEFKYEDLVSSEFFKNTETVCDRIILRDRTGINV